MRSWTKTFPMELWSRNEWDRGLSRGARFRRIRKAKSEKIAVDAEMRAMLNRATPRLPVRVTMTRIGPGLFDDDNLGGAFKHVRDGIAKVLGVDDKDPRVTWDPQQEKGKPERVRIVIEEVE